MLKWFAWHAWVLCVRLAITAVAIFTVTRIISTALGYRMEIEPMFGITAIAIVVLRVWMPWQKSD